MGEVQTEQDGNLRTDRYITEVIEHVQGKSQLPLAPAALATLARLSATIALGAPADGPPARWPP